MYFNKFPFSFDLTNRSNINQIESIMSIRVLTLCIHNSARSQIAEAYLKKFGVDRLMLKVRD